MWQEQRRFAAIYAYKYVHRLAERLAVDLAWRERETVGVKQIGCWERVAQPEQIANISVHTGASRIARGIRVSDARSSIVRQQQGDRYGLSARCVSAS